MEIPFLSLLLQGIPEMIAFSIFVLAMNGDLKNWKKGVVVGVSLAITVFLIRKFPVSYGLHTLILMMLSTVLFKILFNFDLIKIIKSILICAIILGIGEVSSYLIFINLFGYSAQELTGNIVVWIVSGWPQIILLLVFAYIFYAKGSKNKEVDESVKPVNQ